MRRQARAQPIRRIWRQIPSSPYRATVRLPRAVPAVLTLATGLGALGWLAAATIVPATDHPYLPDDGHTARVQMLDGDLAQVESATRPVVLLDGSLGRMVAEDPAVAATDTALRLTFAPDAAQDQVVLVAHGGTLALHGISLDGVGRVFAGGIPLEPGGFEGAVEIAGGTATRLAGTVAVAEVGQGCDEVTIEPTGASDAVERIDLTLCDGRGLIALRLETPGADPVGFTGTAEEVPFDETTLEVRDRDWAAASDWEPAAYVPTATDAFGETVGARSLAGTPAPLLNGDVALLDDLGDDVVVYAPGPDGAADVVWRGHPGGHLVGVVAVGDMVVAVRASGSMVAYSVDGVRLWESEAATDSVVGSVVPVTGRLTFATLDGVVWMVDAVTGDVLWSHRVAERLGDGVVADERVTFAFDTEGNIVGFAANGQQAFDGSVPSAFEVVALDDANSYLARGNTVEAYELQHSVFQWAADIPGAVTAMCSTQDRLAVATTEQTYALDPSSGAVAALDEHADALECGRSAVAIAIGNTLWVRPTNGDPGSLQMPGPVVELQFRGFAGAPEAIWVVDEQALVRWSS